MLNDFFSLIEFQCPSANCTNIKWFGWVSSIHFNYTKNIQEKQMHSKENQIKLLQENRTLKLCNSFHWAAMETIGPFAYLLKSANFVTFILLNKHSQSNTQFYLHNAEIVMFEKC